MILAFCAAILFATTFADAVLRDAPFSQRGNFPSFPDVERDALLSQPHIGMAKIGRIIEGRNLIWGENTGWVNLKTKHADLKIGSNILAGWVWLENCGWVCLGEGRPLNGERYSNRRGYDWGINNDGQGRMSGYAWSEVTGWISFRTNHSRVYLDEGGQFYGYAWGENVGWMHFGLGGTVQYLAKADGGPWRGIGPEAGDKLAGGPEDSEICSGCDLATGLKSSHGRYDEDADSVYVFRRGRNDSCASIWRCDEPVYISSLSTLSPIRAPPVIA